jgi:hypothetical protein
MTEWISPVDRHRHYGEAGRASCAVCRLEAERDRLRAVVVATATDARVLVKALGQGNADAAAALAERIYDRHEPHDVGEQLDGSTDGTDG